MNKKITAKSIVKFVGWATIVASIVLIIMKLSFNENITVIQIFLGFSIGTFCLYLGYLHKVSNRKTDKE